MANVLNFRLTVEDLLGPQVAEAIRRVQELGRRVEAPHRLNVDTSQAKGAISGIMGLVGKLGLAAALATGAKEVVTMGANLEQTKIQFETFTGSAEKGNAVLAQLQKFAQITPFDDNQVIGAGRQLLAFGEDAKSLNPILTKLGNISSATGKDFGELVSIYGKNKLSGVIQGEDLNQLNDSGIPVMKSLAAQLGVNVSQVRKLGADGKITFSMLDKAFDELGGKGGTWGKLMDKQSQSVAGRWSSLVGFAQNLGGRLGEMLNPLVGKIVDGGNAVLTFIQQNTAKIKQMLQPVTDAVQPLVDVFQRLMLEQYGNAEASDILATVFNRIGTVIKLVAPFIKVAATLLGTVWEQGQRVVGVLTKFWETSPRLQKFFAGLYTGALAAFKGIAEAVGKYLGGVGTFIEGVFTGDFHKMGDGLKKTLSAVLDTQDVGKKAAAGFVEGYQKGIKPVKIFGTDKSAASTDAATAFMSGSKPAGSKPAALTADASKGKVSGEVSGSGRVVNITLNANNPFRDSKFYINDLAADAKSTMQQFENWLMAGLNDVNTYASNFR